MFEELMNPRLALAKEVHARDMAHWEKEYKAVQAACPHEKLGQMKGRTSFDSYSQSSRVCFQCGICESSNSGVYRLLTNKFYTDITAQEMASHRVGNYYDYRLDELVKRSE